MVATRSDSLAELRPGDHVCWIVDDPATALARAAVIEAAGAQFRQKTLAFGPPGSELRDGLRDHVAIASDPWTDVLSGERFEPAVMYEMFRAETAAAVAEGYGGLRLVADMEWLLPAGLPISELVRFELMLDRVVHELGATVVCAYPRRSFVADALGAMTCVHAINVGAGVEPQFQIVATDPATWCVTGEVDVAVRDVFAAAIDRAVSAGPCRLDVSGLGFIDVAATRALADAVSRSAERVDIVGGCATLERCWYVAGFDSVAPTVAFDCPPPAIGRS